MSAAIGAMRATLGLDTAQFESRAKAAGKAATGMSEGMARSFDRARQSIAGQARTFDELRASIDPAFAASQKYAEVQRQISGMVESGAASQRAANLVLEQAAAKYMGVETAAQAAARAQREMAAAADQAARAQQQQAQATAIAAQNYQSLRASLDPVYAASKRYEAAQETLAAAVKAGVVSQDQANRVLSQAGQHFLGAADGARNVGAASKNMAPQVQNAAYQIGDFAVQIAGGTSAMRAFSQQAPQLLGGFGMWGAVLGGAVAVLAALAPALLASGDAAKTASDAIDDLTASSDRYRQSLDDARAPMEEIIAQYGSMATEGRAAMEAIAQANLAKAFQDMQAAIKAVNGDLLETREYASSAFLGGTESARALIDTFGMASDKAATLRGALVELESAKGLKEQAGAALEVQAALLAAYGSTMKMPPELLAAYTQMGNIADAAAQVQSGMDGSAKSATDLKAESDAAAAGLRDAEAAARSLAAAMAAAAGFSGKLDDGIVVLEAKLDALKKKQDANNAGTIAGLRIEAQARRDSALAAGKMNVVAQARYGTDLAQIDATEKLLAGIEAQTKANSAAASAGKSAAGASAKQAKQLEKEAEKWRDLIDPMNKYRRQQSELDELLKSGALTSGEVQQALAAINKEIAESDPLLKTFASAAESAVDYMLGGFKDGFKGLFDIAKDTLKQVIAMFAKNRIMLSLGMGGTVGGVAGAAAGVADAPAAGGGSLGILGSLGGIGSSFLSGASGLITSLTGAGGGLGAAGTYLSGVLGTATSSLGAFAAAAGAIALPLAAAAAVFSFFKTKTKLIDAGLRVTVSSMDALVETFKEVEKSKFFGLSKSKSTTFTNAAAEVSNPIVDAVTKIQASVQDTAKALGVGAKAFDGFSASIEFSTKGLSDDEISAKLQENLTTMGDSYASKVFGFVGINDKVIAKLEKQIKNYDATQDKASQSGLGAVSVLGRSGLAGLQKQLAEAVAANTQIATDASLSLLIHDGEGAAAALTRLATSMSTVNGIMDTLGHTFKATGLAGAGMASDLADLFGGLDAMTTATSSYYQAFYTEQERNAVSTRQATKLLKEIGVVMPRTRDQYRAMIEALDLTTIGGRKAYAALVGMSGVFDQILPAIGSFTAEIAAMAGAITTDLDGMIAKATEAQKASETAAKAWYATSQSLRDFVAGMRGTISAMTSPAQAKAFNEARYQATLASAMAGDADAAKAITGVATSMLDSTKTSARTSVEMARAQARVASDLSLLSGVTAIEGAREDVLAGLAGQQVDLLTDVRDYLSNGGTLDAKQIDALNAQLGSLEIAIAAAKEISYAALKERIDVTVDLLATADIPAELRKLLASAANGISGYVDFIARSDLSPDLMWLAMHGASEHLKTVNYLVGAKLPLDLAKVALKGASDHMVKVRAAIDGNASSERLLKAITGSSTGKITLGGSFIFDPAKGFSIWYESATKGAITVPMGNLRASLTDLSAAVRAETARANAEKAKNAAVDKAQAALSRAAEAQKAALAKVQNAVGAVNAFDGNTKGNLVGKDGSAVQAYVNAYGKAVLNAVAVSGYSDASLDLWKKTFWKDGGLEDQMYAANKEVTAAEAALEKARAAVRAAGGVPAFEGGGFTGSGSRSGGLDGKGGFMAMLHPQETVIDHRAPGRSAPASMDAEIVAELKSLRAEVARMRSENTQLALRTEKNTYDAATVLRREERRTLAES